MLAPVKLGSGGAVRDRLLDAAAGLVERDGLSAVAVDAVCSAAGVTKGALYHHFVGREALLAAVAEERVAPPVVLRWDSALADADVLKGISSVLTLFMSGTAEQMLAGCPLLRLGLQAPATGGVRDGVAAGFDQWRATLSGGLAQGQAVGVVNPAADAAAEADFVIAALEGALSVARTTGDPAVLTGALGRLLNYVETLRPPPPPASRPPLAPRPTPDLLADGE